MFFQDNEIATDMPCSDDEGKMFILSSKSDLCSSFAVLVCMQL